MAIETSVGPNIGKRDLPKEARKRLGDDFRRWIAQVEDERREMVVSIWNKAQENLDGRADVKDFPWFGASNAFAPITGTYSDAIQSRLFQAATAHDPTTLMLPRGAGEVVPGVSAETWAKWWQNIMRWSERDDVDYKSLMEEVTLLAVHFGDAWVLNTWEEQQVMDIDITESGKVVKVPRVLYSRPMPKVLHPKDVFIRWDAPDHQTERLVGFQFDLDLPTLEEWMAKGVYDDEVADQIAKTLGRAEEDREAAARGYFRSIGTRVYTPDEFEEAKLRQLKMDDSAGGTTVKMLRMYARVDLDGDGIPEDTVYDVVKETGEVASSKYANYLHRERPLNHFWYKKRPGSQYNIGVPEMLLNVQDIVNTGLRDHFDNNKVQNTSIVMIRKNSGIKKGAKVYPMRTFWVNNPREDVVISKLGAGGGTTDIPAIMQMDQWGQYIVGISAFNLGQEQRSRTPATTTVSLIQEANIRHDRIIEMFRHATRKMQRQTMMLYFQNGSAEKLARIAAVEDEEREQFIAAFLSIDPQDMMDSIIIDPDISSNSFNRQSRRQEEMALFSQLKAFYDIWTQLMQFVGGAAQDQAAQATFMKFAQGYMRQMRNILDTFEKRDQNEMLPTEFLELLQQITSVEVTPDGSGTAQSSGASESPSPAQSAQGLVASEGPAAGPVAPEGRPVNGLDRLPGEANGGDVE